MDEDQDRDQIQRLLRENGELRLAREEQWEARKNAEKDVSNLSIQVSKLARDLAETQAHGEEALAALRATHKTQMAAIESMLVDSANLERGQLLAANEKLRGRLQTAMAFIWDLLEGDVKVASAGTLRGG